MFEKLVEKSLVLLKDRCILRVVRNVRLFPRIRLIVIQFHRTNISAENRFLAGKINRTPFDVAMVWCAKRPAHRGIPAPSANHLGNCSVMERDVVSSQERDQALAFDMSRNRQTGQFTQGRINVKEFSDCGDSPIARDARRRDNQRRTGSVFVVGQFAPVAVLAEMITVIAPKANNCAVRDPAPLQRMHQLADLRVHVGPAGSISMDESPLLRLEHGAGLRDVRIIAKFTQVTVKAKVVGTPRR